MKQRKKKNYEIKVLLTLIIGCLLVICVMIYKGYIDVFSPKQIITTTNFDVKLNKVAAKNNLSSSQWPEKYIEKAKSNPEIEEFVLNYPIKKDKNYSDDLSNLKNCKSVPLLMQWDERWGYNEYAGDIVGFTGCGPTCLSMVSIYLLNDTKYTPKYVTEFSIENGYATNGNGSKWTLISEGGNKLGLNVQEIPLDKNTVIKNLKQGNPIICVVGPGDFTKTGHFIVLTDYKNGMIKVNDPNSEIRSSKNWDYDKIEPQIKNLWVCK